jgi:hypothetical protein
MSTLAARGLGLILHDTCNVNLSTKTEHLESHQT